ncbi:MAG: hypothetical protein E6Q97_10100 [Desulfurellales bacterium]|nr:MAG: hypothetical protein E6Q97_10100 [Desulfurellales bacterium]
MARTRTLAQLWASAQLAADMPNTTFATSAEGYERINYSIARLYGKLVNGAGADYFREARTLTTTANQAYTDIGATGSSLNTLAGSFMRLLSLEATIGEYPQDIPELPNWEDRHLFANQAGWTGRPGISWRLAGPYYTLEYAANGARVHWWPTPVAVHTVTAYVIPSAPVLVNASDTFDGINGFEDWVIHDVAIYLKNREESDPSALMAERDRIESEIMTTMGRKHASPKRVRDVRGRRGWPRGDGGFGL